jgi:hypothetical protein
MYLEKEERGTREINGNDLQKTTHSKSTNSATWEKTEVAKKWKQNSML